MLLVFQVKYMKGRNPLPLSMQGSCGFSTIFVGGSMSLFERAQDLRPNIAHCFFVVSMDWREITDGNFERKEPSWKDT